MINDLINDIFIKCINILEDSSNKDKLNFITSLILKKIKKNLLPYFVVLCIMYFILIILIIIILNFM